MIRRLLLSLGMITIAATVPITSAGGQEGADTVQRGRQARTAAIDTIRAAELTPTAPVSNVRELLDARVPGLSVTDLNGTVGSSSLIRIRGAAFITQSDEPLVYIDGVRISSDNYAVNSANVSLLNALDPDEIESIEVIKGPAAATLYSADASAGIIRITTKRGRLGERFTQRVSLGASQFRSNFTPPANVARCVAPGIYPNSTLCQGHAVGTLVSDNPMVRDHVLNNANGSAVSWQGYGGGRSYTYFLSYGLNHQDGVLPSNQTTRHAARTNFTVVPASQLTIDANIGLSHDLVNQVAQGTSFESMLAGTFGNPLGVGSPNDGWLLAGFGASAIAHISDQFINKRILPSVTATYTPTTWFTNRLTVGGDMSRIDRRVLRPQNDSGWYQVSGASFYPGSMQQDGDRRHIYTLEYLGNVRHALGAAEHWVADLSFGTQLISSEDDFSTLSAYDVGADPSFEGATVTGQSDSHVTQRSVGYVGQLQLSYRNRLFLQYGGRIDHNTFLGSTNQSVFRPRYGASYVISEEPFWKQHVPIVNTLRLRAAYGTTGPRLALSAPMLAAGGSPGAVPTIFTGLAPGGMRNTEFEAGIDASAANNRIGFEFTYYDKDTRDIIPGATPPSIFGTPILNVASVLNRGVEFAVNANVISTDNVGLTGRFTMNTLHNEVTSLGGFPQGFPPTSPLSPPALITGYPLGAIFGQRVTGVDVANNHAIVTDVPVYLGSPTPTREGTLGGDLMLFRRVRLSALAEFKSGYRKFNVDAWTRDATLFNSALSQTMNDLPPEERLRIAGPFVNSSGTPVGSLNVVDYYVEDASFVRLRELSATLIFPAGVASGLHASAASVTVGGRNLALWTDYRGYDPETITVIPTDGMLVGIDQTTLPQPQQFYLRLNLGF